MDEQELSNIPVPELDLLFLESRTDASTLLSHDSSFLRRRLAGPHRPDELP